MAGNPKKSPENPISPMKELPKPLLIKKDNKDNRAESQHLFSPKQMPTPHNTPSPAPRDWKKPSKPRPG